MAKSLDENFLRYRGRSMWPVFQEGDLLQVDKVGWQDLRVGDCITYRSGNDEKLVTHRIIAMRGSKLLTRGDALPRPDDHTVRSGQLVGRVKGRFRLGEFKMVSGGIAGRLAGKFYRYAGRLDPQRDAHGGRVARLLRSSVQWLATWLYRRGTVREFDKATQDGSRYWLSGKRPWARFDHVSGGWVIPWPQSLVIDPDRLPGNG